MRESARGGIVETEVRRVTDNVIVIGMLYAVICNCLVHHYSEGRGLLLLDRLHFGRSQTLLFGLVRISMSPRSVS